VVDLCLDHLRNRVCGDLAAVEGTLVAGQRRVAQARPCLELRWFRVEMAAAGGRLTGARSGIFCLAALFQR
jgi:hypothetical protein